MYVCIGELHLGEPCAPYTITRIRHGTEKVTETITGRKISLLTLRKQALQDHFCFMRLSQKDTILAGEREKLEKLVGPKGSEMSDSDLRDHVQQLLSTRYFALWHDHSTVCGCGYLLVTCKEVYNSSTYYTNAEYEEITG